MRTSARPVPQAIAATALKEAAAARSAFAPETDSGGMPAAPPRHSPPVPLYTVAIETLAKDASGALDQAEQCGWRVLTIFDGERQLVDLAGEWENPSLMAVLPDGCAEALVKAGTLAEKSVDDKAEYEVRVLDLGRLGIASLWLHNDDPETPDYFFTLEAEPKKLTREKLLKTAHERAKRRVRIDAEAREAAKRGGEPDDLGG